MSLWHDQEVLIAHWTFWQGNIKMLWLAPDNQVSIDARILKAEPAVLVFLDPDAFHLKVDLQQATLQCQLLIFLYKCLRLSQLFKLDEAIWLVRPLLLFPTTSLLAPSPLICRLTTEEVKLHKLAMLLNELLYLLLPDMSLEAGHIDDITISLIHSLVLLHPFPLLHTQPSLQLLLPHQQRLTQLKPTIHLEHSVSEWIRLRFTLFTFWEGNRT